MTKKKRRRRPPRPPRPAAASPAAASPAAASKIVLAPRPGGTADVGTRAPPGLTGEGMVGLVVTGALDDELAALQAAISRRWADLRREAAHVAAARLRVGDRVRIVHGMRPQYLQGATGTVTGWSGRSAVVQLDMPVGRYGTGEVRCPPLGLAPLASGEV